MRKKALAAAALIMLVAVYVWVVHVKPKHDERFSAGLDNQSLVTCSYEIATGKVKWCSEARGPK